MPQTQSWNPTPPCPHPRPDTMEPPLAATDLHPACWPHSPNQHIGIPLLRPCSMGQGPADSSTCQTVQQAHPIHPHAQPAGPPHLLASHPSTGGCSPPCGSGRMGTAPRKRPQPQWGGQQGESWTRETSVALLHPRLPASMPEWGESTPRANPLVPDPSLHTPTAPHRAAYCTSDTVSSLVLWPTGCMPQPRTRTPTASGRILCQAWG
mmetsp:Transcript_20365/g.36399  ORF Transcript_20365/g.36399 Transcript_20365/m.36399 type:complete len:208 (+) Transcript_20365:1463-2086(+)